MDYRNGIPGTGQRARAQKYKRRKGRTLDGSVRGIVFELKDLAGAGGATVAARIKNQRALRAFPILSFLYISGHTVPEKLRKSIAAMRHRNKNE
jgi:hypothetical protein